MRRRLEITPGFCILWALLLLMLPLRLILAAGAAALLHECCHALVIRLTGGAVTGITIGAGGTVMETTPMKSGQELVCALAGPLGSFLLVLLYQIFPLLALCALVQGCFNLLPLYPLDGGRALACLLPSKWRRGIEIMTLLGLLALAVGLRMGWGPVLAWGMLAMRKIPCKDHRFGVE